MSEVARIEASGGIRVADLTAAIRSAATVGEAREARARIEAIKAWAKVHGRTKDLRLDLLRLEVEALVRLAELDGLDGLSSMERRAATYLAGLTEAERDELIGRRGTFTTASGMCSAMWREEELERSARMSRVRGRHFAERPEAPTDVYDEAAIESARAYVHGVSAVLGNVLSTYTSTGGPFTIADVAEQIVEEAANGAVASDDPALMDGIREVVREAIRKGPVGSLDGTVIPRLITARLDDGSFVRVPVENATMAHLDDMITLRREQLAQDRAALDRLEAFAGKVRRLPGGTLPTSRIGALIAASLLKDTA